MASNNNYDDLLESFMNNSAKAYDEDKTAHQEKADHLPSSYNVSASDKKIKKAERGRKIENELAAKKEKKRRKRKPQKAKTPGQKFLSGAGKALLGMVMIVGVVGIVCFSVMAIYGYSVVYGDPVFDLTEEAAAQNQTSFIYGTDDDKVVEITRLHGEESYLPAPFRPLRQSYRRQRAIRHFHQRIDHPQGGNGRRLQRTESAAYPDSRDHQGSLRV